MMNALRTETDNPGATHKLVCGCDILSPNSQSSRDHYDSFGNQVRHCNAPAAETSGSPFKLTDIWGHDIWGQAETIDRFGGEE